MRQEPFSLEAEKAVIGSMILSREFISHAIQCISPSDFYHQTHQDICSSIFELYNTNTPIDVIGLNDKHNCLDYLVEITSFAMPDSAKHHMGIVKGKSIRRKYINAANQIIEKAYEGDYESILDFKNDIQQLMDIDIAMRNTKEIQNMQIMMNVLEDIEKKYVEKEDNGIKYGFHWLDNQTSGIHAPDLTILAARPSVGKTSFACSVAMNVAKQKKNVAIFSLEMGNEQIAKKILSMESGVEFEHIRNPKLLNDNSFRKITNSISKMFELPLYFADSALKIEEIRAECRNLKNKKQLDYVIVDYLQLCETIKKSNNTVERVSHLSRAFKLLAKELSVPVLLLSQLNRSSEQDNRRPKLTDLRDSGSIEQDADNVFFLHDANYGNYDSSKQDFKVPIELIIAKQRNGVRDVYKEITFMQRWQKFAN